VQLVDQAPRKRLQTATETVSASASAGDTLWYKDAVIYEAHVRAFYDSNADGMGDFRGLAEKLDYLQELGVTAIWLLPFFPSPWKDDGYDIADFRSVHPAYGTLRDFQNFLKEAHRRNLRIVTELVINHTSDQHDWFQKSRRSEPGSKWRNFYVWSDSPDKYAGVRIIFKDFEPSNWSWDPIAKAYYWHRFFSHQPDLNFDNPTVRRAVLHTLDYWAGMGVDGFRLDAIPYLYEREGTSCENLTETHAFLKEIRAHLDARFPNRMLLSEANMWPEDAVAYFGNGDECHMNFHFPLMPRLFMALQREDRLPIIEILKRTPALPETCQWAMFLRNHDELTLEMVTDDERDYMYRAYASDRRARINLGIRRRLAPLLSNDRARIELMNALLFSMPGTPVIYYGDEIGMGDNVYLGDRNGVRTPMQWSPDRNAGFSAANPQKLYLPVNIDPLYHYEAINVETQEESPHSLLNWTKRIIALRKRYKAFGRGTLEFLYPRNQHVLAYIRRYEQETILVVANLSRFAQAVQLDLERFRGLTPVEMFGRTDFPVVCEGYYALTLGPSSFFWFSFEQRETPVNVSAPIPEADRSRLSIVAIDSFAEVWSEESVGRLCSALPRFLQSQKWFTSKRRRLRSIDVTEAIPIHGYRYLILRAEYATGEPEMIALPVGAASGDAAERMRDQHPGSLIAEIKAGDGLGFFFAATEDSDFSAAMLDAFNRRRRFNGEHGVFSALPNRHFRQFAPKAGEQLAAEPLPSSTVHRSIRFDERLVMKLLCTVEAGLQPGAEIGEALAEDVTPPFPNVPLYLGSLEYQPEGGEATTLALMHAFVPNRGTAWQHTRSELTRYVDAMQQRHIPAHELESTAPVNFYSLDFALSQPPALATELIGPYLSFSETMGRRTAELHRQLASFTDPAFATEPFNDFYRQSLFQGNVGLTGRRMEFIRQHYSEMRPEVQALATKVLDGESRIVAKFRAIYDQRIPSQRQRFHGRLHLGHMLVTDDDIVIFDFESDPTIAMSATRIKRCPLRDVASMLLSFGYAAQVAARQTTPEKLVETISPEARASLRFWYSHVSAAYMRGYWSVASGAQYLPATRQQQETLLQNYLLERALLDLRDDIQENPELSGMPLRVLLHLLGGDQQPAAPDTELANKGY
jgi:maltose alpha-D-glucosyltransferase/alpha-amylase